MAAAPQAVRPAPRGLRCGFAAAPSRGGRGAAGGRVRTGAMGAEAPPLGTVVVLLGSPAGLAAYWWGVLVPSERRSLSLEKRKGGLNAYLEELEASEGRGLEKWFYTDYLQKRQARRAKRAALQARRAGEVEVEVEVEESLAALDREEDRMAAADPAFLSGDNPLVQVFLVLGSLTLFATLFGGR